MKTAILLALMLITWIASPAHAQTYKYAPEEVTLYGTLVSMPGESPDGRKYMYPAVQLVTPISVQRQDDYSPYEGGVLLLQLVLNQEMMHSYQRLRGKRVSIIGSLLHSHTGWHHTNVIIDVSGISESP
ncbi:DUF4431 domain-containing protein [Pseudoxanthomonas suwonensis]